MDELKELREQYEAKMGKKPFMGWTAEDLRARMTVPDPVSAPLREKTLHELNMETRAIDRALRDTHNEAGERAKKAVVETLNEKRPDGKRARKPLRPAD